MAHGTYWVNLNSKVTEMKEAADLLTEYSKKATEYFPVNNVSIIDAIVAVVATFSPVVNP